MSDTFTKIQFDTSVAGRFRTGLITGACKPIATDAEPIFQDPSGDTLNSVSKLENLNPNLRNHIVSVNPLDQLITINGVRIKTTSVEDQPFIVGF